MKKHNPSIPIMLREAQGTSPKVYARYEFGQEKSQSLEGTPPLAEEPDSLQLWGLEPGGMARCAHGTDGLTVKLQV